MEKQRTILIADDRPEIRTLVRITLTSDGFSLAKTLAPHLIIMDIDMPGKYNGITATSQYPHHYAHSIERCSQRVSG